MYPEPNKHIKILLVEDDAVDAKRVLRLLPEHDGFEIIHREALQPALDYLSIHSISLVLLDLGLPDTVDASDGLSRIKKAFPYMPVVILTRNENETAVADLLANGAQDYLNKSTVEKEGLSRNIRYAIERQKLLDHLDIEKNSLTRVNDELNEMNRLMVGRESRMIELKRTINELNIELGRDRIFDLRDIDEVVS